MSEVVIEASALGKSYVIRHAATSRQAPSAGGGTLSETLHRAALSLFKRKPRSAGDRPSKEEFFALKDVSFQIRDGESVAIIGRNGAGKSTLLKVLSRITEPTIGSARIRGRIASLLEVGSGFHPELTGRENIYLNGSILGMSHSEIQRKFDEIVAFSGVEKFLDTPVKRYSSGMYVRLAFAVAAHLDPDILVVDEVLAVGDAEFQKKCLGKMEGVAKSGRTVIFVSHNMTAVRNFCSRGIVLQEGRLLFDGSVEDAIDLYSGGGLGTRASDWVRPQSPDGSGIRFSRIQIQLHGRQPDLRLECHLTLHAGPDSLNSMLAVDFLDQTGTPFMQALPSATPFVPATPGEHEVRVDVELPPLIPGTYFLNFWVGPDYNSGTDLISSQLSFNVIDSPTLGRTVPHAHRLGAIVPKSTFNLLHHGT